MCKKNLLMIVLGYVFLFSCQENTKTSVPAKMFLKKHIEKWQSIETGLEYHSTLLLKKDNSFYFSFKAGIGKGLSNGTWVVDSPYIILNSYKTDSCYYVSKFGNEWINISDSLEVYTPITTIDGCVPKNSVKYVIFENDTLYLKNDTLFYKYSDRNIPFTANIFVRSN